MARDVENDAMAEAKRFYERKYPGCKVEDKARARGGHGGYDLLVTTEAGTIKVEVKGRLVKKGEHPFGIPDLHHTEVDRETRQLICDELCVVYFFLDSDQYRIAIIPRASIVREHLEDKLGYKIKSASKNRKFIKGFLVDL
jgi:hypothetical protein